MKSDWVTLQKAILRLNFKGVEESAARFGLETAMNNGEIATREVPRGTRTSWEATEMVELRSEDFEAWLNMQLGIEPKKKGGRPVVKDWRAVDREIIRIANSPDGLPGPAELLKTMVDWKDKHLKENAPTYDTLEAHLKGIYRYIEKGY